MHIACSKAVSRRVVDPPWLFCRLPHRTGAEGAPLSAGGPLLPRHSAGACYRLAATATLLFTYSSLIQLRVGSCAGWPLGARSLAGSVDFLLRPHVHRRLGALVVARLLVGCALGVCAPVGRTGFRVYLGRAINVFSLSLSIMTFIDGSVCARPAAGGYAGGQRGLWAFRPQAQGLQGCWQGALSSSVLTSCSFRLFSLPCFFIALVRPCSAPLQALRLARLYGAQPRCPPATRGLNPPTTL